MKTCLRFPLSLMSLLCAYAAFGQSSNSSQIGVFKSIVNGDWYEPTFINEIQKTKSPFKSQNSLPAIIELDIATRQASGDSLFVGAPSIHEGTSFNVFLRKGHTTNACPTDINDYDSKGTFYELGYSIDKDTVLKIYKYSSEKKAVARD